MMGRPRSVRRKSSAFSAAVLIITFSSLVAAGLPLITAVVGIAIGSLLVMLFTAFTDVNSIAVSP